MSTALSATEAKAQIDRFMEATPAHTRKLRIHAEYVGHCSAGLVSLPRLLDEINASEDEAQQWLDKITNANHALRAAVDALESVVVDMKRVNK
jgi:hypothetical protein